MEFLACTCLGGLLNSASLKKTDPGEPCLKKASWRAACLGHEGPCSREELSPPGVFTVEAAGEAPALAEVP